MERKKIIYKIFSYLIILVIFFFLGKNLIANWQKIKDYTFSFNYYYLILSFILFIPTIILAGFIWNKILRNLEPTKKIPYLRALKIYVYSWFGQYLPGKIWMFMGRVYLASKEGISKEKLTISVIYEIILSITSAFLISLFLLSIAVNFRIGNLYEFYYLPILIIIGGFILIHPRVFYLFFNFVLRRFKKMEIPLSNFLDFRVILKMIFCYFMVNILGGLGFFFLINSITYLSIYNLVDIIGIFILAYLLSMLAVFAPSGLGVREGLLAGFLNFYFSLTMAILISLIARIWATIGELIILGTVFIYSKFRKHEV